MTTPAPDPIPYPKTPEELTEFLATAPEVSLFTPWKEGPTRCRFVSDVYTKGTSWLRLTADNGHVITFNWDSALFIQTSPTGFMVYFAGAGPVTFIWESSRD